MAAESSYWLKKRLNLLNLKLHTKFVSHKTLTKPTLTYDPSQRKGNML